MKNMKFELELKVYSVEKDGLIPNEELIPVNSCDKVDILRAMTVWDTESLVYVQNIREFIHNDVCYWFGHYKEESPTSDGFIYGGLTPEDAGFGYYIPRDKEKFDFYILQKDVFKILGI